MKVTLTKCPWMSRCSKGEWRRHATASPVSLFSKCGLTTGRMALSTNPSSTLLQWRWVLLEGSDWVLRGGFLQEMEWWLMFYTELAFETEWILRGETRAVEWMPWHRFPGVLHWSLLVPGLCLTCTSWAGGRHPLQCRRWSRAAPKGGMFLGRLTLGRVVSLVKSGK